MEELNKIKEALAKEKGYENWNECVKSHPNCMVETLMDIVALRLLRTKQDLINTAGVVDSALNEDQGHGICKE